MCNKAQRVFGFVRWNCNEFKNPTCFKILYFSLVCSIQEYGSVIWNPHQIGLVKKIEFIQKQFLWILAFKLNNVNEPIGYWKKKEI